jgi:imidazolonepropionase-like amidohydrolase
MKAVREFAKKGGVVGMGDDAGFIYEIYGIAFIREFELHQEAGFHPIDVIMHATGNNAKILGMEDQIGRVRKNYLADLIVIDKNPLKNFKYLYPTGTLALEDGKMVNVGGVKWTIKDGIVYHAPTMFEDVKKMVAEAKKARGR